MNDPTLTGRITAVCRGDKKGVAKTADAGIRLRAGHGIEGDAHAGPGHRQISLLDEARIDSMRRENLELPPGAFGENLVISGLDLTRLGLGSRLRIGAEAEIAITQIGKDCHTPCHIFHTIGSCIMPQLGLFARCEQDGDVAPGDAVAVSRLVRAETIQAVVLTISDRCSRGEAKDTAGPATARLLEDELAAHVYREKILPDKQEPIEETLKHYCDGHGIDLALTVGGTGMSPRDVTPEATRAVLDRAAPGFAEAMRAASLKKTPRAMLSRGVSGMRRRTLIINLPGSERGARENLEAVLPALAHGIATLRGVQLDCGREEKS